MLPTMKLFHDSAARIRCMVGPMGSGKTSAAAMDVGLYLPEYLWEQYHIAKTRWLVLRNTYTELRDTTQRTVFEWFPHGLHKKQENIYIITWPIGEIGHKHKELEVEILFRSCERPQDIDKFKSLEITGYWIDESVEVAEEIKLMLKARIGRFPKRCPVSFGLETTNPPDIEHPTYSMFKWDEAHLPPGPIPPRPPLKDHAGFWQPPHENDKNLQPGYYDNLGEAYRDNPDWYDMYVQGKPGMLIRGRVVYQNFGRDVHVAKNPLLWNKEPLYRGWDHSGICPACVVGQIPQARQLQVLYEFYSDKEGIVDFADRVVEMCNRLFPGGEYTDWGDPAGAARYSRREGGFTSNSELIREAVGVKIHPSDNNLHARIQSVQRLLNWRDGILIDPSCTRLINGFLGGYCYPKVPGTEEYAEKPVKNKYSHPHDGLQYLAVKVFKNAEYDEVPVEGSSVELTGSPSGRWMR